LIQKLLIYVMFRDCARLERNVFVTWKEDNVDEQDVDERKECWERKIMLSHIWVKSESDLDQISTSSVQSYRSWYARNITSFFENSCLHECSSFAHFLLIVISIFNAICLNIAYEIRSKLSLSHWIFLYRHSIIRHFYLNLFIWLCTVFNLNSVLLEVDLKRVIEMSFN